MILTTLFLIMIACCFVIAWGLDPSGFAVAMEHADISDLVALIVIAALLRALGERK